MRRIIVFAVTCLTLICAAYAQDAVPTEILSRTLMIKNGDKYGSAFTVDHKGHIYVVTARHMVDGLPKTNATIQVWHDGRWIDAKASKILFPASNDVDIAVLKTDEPIAQPYSISTDESKVGPTLGQAVWFLGFPYQLATEVNVGRIAFIKRGTMSAIDAHDPNAIVLYIDGFNNPGFSGGPVIYWNFTTHTYSILGVVKGYRPDSAKMVINGEPVDTQYMVNSGILIGYSTIHVDQAIENDDKQQP